MSTLEFRGFVWRHAIAMVTLRLVCARAFSSLLHTSFLTTNYYY